MQRLPFPHLVAQRYDHGELQAAVSGVVQNDVPDELHKKGILHQRTPEAIRIEALRTGMGDGTQTPQGDGTQTPQGDGQPGCKVYTGRDDRTG